MMRAIAGRCFGIATVVLLLAAVPGAFAVGNAPPSPRASETNDVAARDRSDIDEFPPRGTASRGKPAGARPPLDAGDDRSQRYWYDGKRKRTLRVDPEWVADFRSGGESAATQSGAKDSGARKTGATRPGTAESAKRVSRRSPLERLEPGSARTVRGPGVSEVLRNEAGSPRALPGGVIVRVHESDRRNAHDILVDAGLRPVRAIDPEQRSWLVESPAGIASLELANRLHESGRFESASPNWWRPRALK